MTIEMFLDQNKKPRLRLRARNGKIVMSSEAYASKRNAIDTAISIYAHAPKWRWINFFKDLTKREK